jgi:hypothetical protein
MGYVRWVACKQAECTYTNKQTNEEQEPSQPHQQSKGGRLWVVGVPKRAALFVMHPFIHYDIMVPPPSIKEGGKSAIH